MSKSPDAFRTISEVADWLGTPTHVLRFWESRFTQVKPVKRAGGRRYYRPADMALLGGIKKLLHDDGLTIRGVQRMLREQGVKHVAAMSPPLDLPEAVVEAAMIEDAVAQTDATEDNVVRLPGAEAPAARQSETQSKDDAQAALPFDAPGDRGDDAEGAVAEIMAEATAPAEAEKPPPPEASVEPVAPPPPEAPAKAEAHPAPPHVSAPKPTPEPTPQPASEPPRDTAQETAQDTAPAKAAKTAKAGKPDAPARAKTPLNAVKSGALAERIRKALDAGARPPAERLAPLHADLAALRARMAQDRRPPSAG